MFKIFLNKRGGEFKLDQKLALFFFNNHDDIHLSNPDDIEAFSELIYNKQIPQSAIEIVTDTDIYKFDSNGILTGPNSPNQKLASIFKDIESKKEVRNEI